MKHFVKLKKELSVKYLPKDVKIFENCISGAFVGTPIGAAKEDIVTKLLSRWKENSTWMAVSYDYFVIKIAEYLEDIHQDAIKAKLHRPDCDFMSRYFFRDDHSLISDLAINHNMKIEDISTLIVVTIDSLRMDDYIETFDIKNKEGDETYIAPTDKLLNHLEYYFKKENNYAKSNWSIIKEGCESTNLLF